jgi:ubiquinone/menaquinone biosynthesis C-methylase UbiE
MLIKLDECIIDILRCPLCKSSIELLENAFICKTCSTLYPKRAIKLKNSNEYVFDFRVVRPSYCVPAGLKKWNDMQDIYEDIHNDVSSCDHLNLYLKEIEGVRDIYTKEFEISGKVLDVGGHQGRLRHFLKDTVSTYISIDPYPDVFKNIDSLENLLKAYPCILEACNFLVGSAENLPFAEKSFDWVHMRSVLDHFSDPFIAIKEAYRVLKNGGRILIGQRVESQNGKCQSNFGWPFKGVFRRTITKTQREGFRGLKKAAMSRIKTLGKEPDDHVWCWKTEDVLDLMDKSGFVVEKKYWQNVNLSEPVCIYLSAIKK